MLLGIAHGRLILLRETLQMSPSIKILSSEAYSTILVDMANLSTCASSVLGITPSVLRLAIGLM